MGFYCFGNRPKASISSATVGKVYSEFKWIEIAIGRAGFHSKFFSPIVFLSPCLKVSPALSSLFSPISSRLVILPGAAGVKGWGRGKTCDSVSLSWRNPLTDLCILAHNDKWVSNFLPDLRATKHISTFNSSEGCESTVHLHFRASLLIVLAGPYTEQRLFS